MAAAIETMCYVGEVPWHKEGTKLTEGLGIEDWQRESGLDWTVSKRPVIYQGAEGEYPTFKDKFVLARDSDDRPFSVVSDRYKPVQPKQVIEFFRELTNEFGMQLETAGSLCDGKRIWALAKMGEETYKVMGTDPVNAYCMLATSYDLTLSTVAQFTSIRVVCNNTLQMSMSNFTGRVSIPHRKEFDIAEVQEQMGLGASVWAAHQKTMETLATIKLDTVKASSVLHKVYDITTETKKDDAANITHVAKIIDLFGGKAIGSDIAGATGWGLVNATTEYLDQHRRARSTSNRFDSAWFGESFNLKQKVVDATLELAA